MGKEGRFFLLSTTIFLLLLLKTPSVVLAFQNTFGWPLGSTIENTRITQPYACFDCVDDKKLSNKFHSGIDMRPCNKDVTGSCEDGEQIVYAVEEGTACKVIENGKGDGAFGNVLIVKHNDGLYSIYAHLKELPKDENRNLIKKDQKISKHQQIGLVGGTGNGSVIYTPHLHFFRFCICCVIDWTSCSCYEEAT